MAEFLPKYLKDSLGNFLYFVTHAKGVYVEPGKTLDQALLEIGNGKSAYQVWLDLGNTGTEQDFINSLTGMPGSAAGVSTKAIPAGALKLSDITESGIYKVNAGVLNPDIPLSAQTKHKEITIFVASDGTRFYLMQEVNSDAAGQPLYWGYTHFSSSTIYWQKFLSDRSLPLYGKTLCLAGDSIMTTVNASTIGSRTGAVVTNHAKAGSSVSLRSNVNMAAEWDPWALCTRSKVGTTNSIPIENFDYLMIFIGTNDWGNGHPIGTMDSVDELTILGAYNVALRNFISRKPDIKILIVTPMFRNEAETTLTPKLSEVGEAIENLAKSYGIPVLNMMKNGMVNDYNKATFLSADLLHPNETGKSLIDSKFSQFINSSY